MPTAKMHAHEVETSVALVANLIAAQFPRWAGLPITAVASTGTDHALYRLGEEWVVRLPRIDWAASQVEKEQRWLPTLAPHLPLAIPAPLAMGAPGAGYPWRWSVVRWLEGENISLERIDDPLEMVRQLAQFITALHRIDPAGGPPPGAGNSWRGAPLAQRDAETRAAIAAVRDAYDPRALTALWEAALQAPAWQAAPVWVHGDLQPGNLLARAGRLSAVIDFGCLGVGDPACDLMIAWNFLTASARGIFRSAVSVDEAAWARGRGWALSVALIALPYYQHTNPTLANMARTTLDEILAESGPVPAGN